MSTKTFTCIEKDCSSKQFARSYCKRCYSRHHYHGDFKGVPNSSKKGIRTNTGKTLFKKGQESPLRGRSNVKLLGHSHGFKKGNTPWNKDKKRPDMAGSKNPMWRGGKKSENEKQRIRFRKFYQGKVFARDNYTCQICDQYGGSLQVDHIKRWSEYPELRFEMDNCRTVCMACHYYITFKRKMPEGIIWGHNLSRRIGK